MKNYRVLLYGILGISVSTLDGASLVEGNVRGGARSFSFSLSSQVFINSVGYLFVGSAAEAPRNEWALSVAHRDSAGFSPLALAHVTLNGKEKQKNPLQGAAIKHLSLCGTWPVVVTAKALNRLYLIENYKGTFDQATKRFRFSQVTIASDVPHDSEGQLAQAIIGLACSSAHVFVPVKAHNNSLAAGFDIAVASFVRKADDENKKGGKKEDADDNSKRVKKGLAFFDVLTGKAGGNKAIRLDVQSPFIGVNAPVKELLSDEVNLTWADVVNRLYIPLHVTTGDQTSDAARALVLGTMDQGKLVLKPIAPDTAIGPDCIIGTRGAHEKIAVFKVCPMRASTWLRYLIGVGGVGEPEEVKRKVFALPLVYLPESEFTGTIAKKDQQPKEFFSNESPFALVERSFVLPASRPEDMPSPLDPAARVGQADAPGRITDIAVQGDAVFVSVTDPTEHCKPGIFHSQALFDATGRIVQWTRWSRVGGIDTSIKHFSYDAKGGVLWYMPCDEHAVVTTVCRTGWQQADKKVLVDEPPLSAHINALVAPVVAGIKHLAVYDYDTPGFSRTITQKLSLLVATGYQRVMVVETGNDKDGLFGPVKRFDKSFESSDGTLSTMDSACGSLTITGGVLDELGPLVASAIVSNGTYGWLVVGGKNGLAVLADEAGRGWPVSSTEGLESGLGGLSSSMKFIKVGAYQNVHTLLADQGKLFVVTPTRFDGLELSPGLIKRGQHARGTTLAKSNFIAGHRYFLDATISGGCVILATTGGMVYLKTLLGELAPIRTSDWQEVEIPYSAGAVSRILAVNPVAKSYERAHSDNIYIINSSASNDQARIYRFYLERKNASFALHLLPDCFTYETGRAFFMNLGVYRGFWASDGAHAFLTGTAFGSIEPFVESIDIGPKLRGPNAPHQPYMALYIKGAETIGRVVREPASGAWIVWGDFGVRFNT